MDRWPGLQVATGGLLLWLLAAGGTLLGFVHLGLIELLFLVAPLVIVPIGLDLLTWEQDRMESGGAVAGLERTARAAQPLGAVIALLSFLFPAGALAGGLAAVWVIVCALVTLAALGRVLVQGPPGSLSEACLVAGPLYLSVGGIGLMISRLGATPLGYVEPIHLLVGVHFHFTGFALPLIAGATGRSLRRSATARRIFGPVALGVLLTPALLAGGWTLGWPILKAAAALLLSASTLALAGLMLVAMTGVRRPAAKGLLALASASIALGMILAGLYALGEFTEEFWLSIPQMAAWHGMANAFGFSMCGLLAWSLVARDHGVPSPK